VRRITVTLIVLLALGYFASRVEWSRSHSTCSATDRLDDGWRRTAQGWEHRSHWEVLASMQQEPFGRRCRPWTIAALQLLLSLLAFQLACPAVRQSRRLKRQHADATPSEHPHHVTA
jgi:hypothetical protein